MATVTDEWLKILLEQMQKDIDEIKSDVKKLDGRNNKADGAMLAISAIVSAAVSALAIYLKA